MAAFHWLPAGKSEELKLPQDYPNADINLSGYDSGFEDCQAVVAGTNGFFIITICIGIPRRPVILPRCGHLFSQACIEKVSKSKKVENFGREYSSNTCPNCKSSFSQTDTNNSRPKTREPNEFSNPFNLNAATNVASKGTRSKWNPTTPSNV